MNMERRFSKSALSTPARVIGRGSAKTTIVGYIIDVNYRIRVDKPVIILTIKKLSGEVENVEYYGMQPYCFLRYSSFADVDRIIEALNGLQGVMRAYPAKKTDYGKREIPLIRVVTDIPTRVRDLRDAFKSIDGVVDWEEADIPFVLRFIIDNDIHPCRKANIKVVRRFGSSSFIESIRDDIEYVAEFETIPFSYATFDIEVWNENVITKPERDKVLMIGLECGNVVNGKKQIEFEELFSLDSYRGNEIQKERRMLGAFMAKMNEFNPDLIVTYAGTMYDIEYLVNRCKILGLVFGVGRNKSPVFVKKDKKYGTTVYIDGRVNYDVMIPAKRDIGDLPHKTLKDVADYTGVLKHEERVEMPYYTIWKWWQAGGMRRDILKAYCMDDVRATSGIGIDVFLTNMVALAYITRVPLSMAMTQRYGFLNSHFIGRYLYHRGMLIPKKDLSEGEDLEGAVVLESERGIFENFECWDIKSMYPSIIIEFNLSFETLVMENDKVGEAECNMTVDGKWKFRKSPKGILPTIAGEYIEARSEYKKIWKSKTEDDPDKGMYEALQLTYKRLANALYGMTAQRKSAARFYCFPIADSITFKGRETVLRISEIADKEFGCRTIYGDTDSVYISAVKDREKFVKRINEITRLEIERDYGIQTFVSEGKKKRYFFRKEPKTGQKIGDLVVRGYEHRRGDWIDLCKNAEGEIMNIILDTKNIDMALKVSEKYINILRNRKFKIDEVTIFKTLTKDISEYDESHGQVHVAVAEREMIEFGVVPEIGEKNGVVIVEPNAVKKYYPKTTEKLSFEDLRSKVTNRAVLANRVSDVNDIDIDYYIQSQFVKPLSRILSLFGVKDSAIMASEVSVDSLRDLNIDGLF